jgi:hypothetical protein
MLVPFIRAKETAGFSRQRNAARLMCLSTNAFNDVDCRSVAFTFCLITFSPFQVFSVFHGTS